MNIDSQTLSRDARRAVEAHLHLSGVSVDYALVRERFGVAPAVVVRDLAALDALAAELRPESRLRHGE